MRSIKKLSFTHKPRSSSVPQLIDVEIFEHASSSPGRFDGEWCVRVATEPMFLCWNSIFDSRPRLAGASL